LVAPLRGCVACTWRGRSALPKVACIEAQQASKETTMTTQLTQQAAALFLSALMTLFVLAGLNSLASSEHGAATALELAQTQPASPRV
jgi:hypothetical protein